MSPDLAASAEWREGGTLLAVRLRAGLRFVDGRELDADDVLWTFGTLLDPATGSPRRGAFAMLDPARPIGKMGPQEIAFRCAGALPCPSLLSNLTVGIVPKGASPDDIRLRPIGGGPMRISTDSTEDEVRFEPVSPRASRIFLRVVPDATSRALALQSGSIDLAVNNLSPDVVSRFRADPRFRVVEGAGTNFAYLGFNCAHPRLADRRVREAIALSIDRSALLEHLHRGLGRLTETPLPPGNFARAEELPPLVPDLARAARLLDEAGLFPGPDGVRVRFLYKTSTDETAILQATAIQAMLARSGIAVEVRPLDFATFFQDVKAGAVEIWSLVWTNVADPDLLRMIFHSRMTPPAGWNRGRFGDPQLDDLLDRASRSVDPAASAPLWREAQQIARRELPIVPLWHRSNVAVARAGVEGIDPGPFGDFRFLEKLRRGR